MKTVKISDLIIEFDAMPPDASVESPHPIFQMAEHIDELKAALRACKSVLDGTEMNKKALIDALQKATAALLR